MHCIIYCTAAYVICRAAHKGNWLPACRLTPAASYITIRLNARLIANKGLPIPSSRAIDVVTACTLSHQQVTIDA